MNTPVCLMLFNRPDCTARVFSAVRHTRPKKLFLIADGPRKTHPQDYDKVKQSRDVVECIDWPCDVTRIYAEENLGPKKRFFSANNRVFEEVDKAIFLEDDTLPHIDFFNFCTILLNKYQNNTRIMYITGTNNLWGRYKVRDSYFFSNYILPWGWASWRRAWKSFEPNCHSWEENKTKLAIQPYFNTPEQSCHWSKLFDSISNNPKNDDTYDYAWQFNCWKHNGLTIVPKSNLITNIGFGSTATHTKKINHSHIIAAKALAFPLKHPNCIEVNSLRDDWIFRVHALYEEARPWHRRLNNLRIRLGAWKKFNF